MVAIHTFYWDKNLRFLLPFDRAPGERRADPEGGATSREDGAGGFPKIMGISWDG